MRDRARFVWKNPLVAKMNKNDQKWPKNGVFWTSIQMLLANQISVFFNRQYHLGNGLTSDSNFLLLDIHE